MSCISSCCQEIQKRCFVFELVVDVLVVQFVVVVRVEVVVVDTFAGTPIETVLDVFERV